jgi:NADH-quinone oxidoreductase subunit I
MLSLLRSMRVVLRQMLRPRETVRYPEERPPLPPRWKGRIVLTRDPGGRERCVACFLCSAVCPVGCIHIESRQTPAGRREAAAFRINFSRCIFCGLCEEACPTLAIQLTGDFEMGEYDRSQLVYEKEHLLISGPGKHPDYDFYAVSGVRAGEDGPGENQLPPADPRGLLP